MTRYLAIADMAALAGISPATCRSYRSRGLLPEPDVMVGQSPGWTQATADRWATSRG